MDCFRFQETFSEEETVPPLTELMALSLPEGVLDDIDGDDVTVNTTHGRILGKRRREEIDVGRSFVGVTCFRVICVRVRYLFSFYLYWLVHTIWLGGSCHCRPVYIIF